MEMSDVFPFPLFPVVTGELGLIRAAGSQVAPRAPSPARWSLPGVSRRAACDVGRRQGLPAARSRHSCWISGPIPCWGACSLQRMSSSAPWGLTDGGGVRKHTAARSPAPADEASACPCLLPGLSLHVHAAPSLLRPETSPVAERGVIVRGCFWKRENRKGFYTLTEGDTGARAQRAHIGAALHGTPGSAGSGTCPGPSRSPGTLHPATSSCPSVPGAVWPRPWAPGGSG